MHWSLLVLAFCLFPGEAVDLTYDDLKDALKIFQSFDAQDDRIAAVNMVNRENQLLVILQDRRHARNDVPKVNGQAAIVSATFSINHVEPLDEDMESMKVHGTVVLKWHDPVLQWTTKDMMEIGYIARDLTAYGNLVPWTPKIKFQSAQPFDEIDTGNLHEDLSTQLLISSSGNVTMQKKFFVIVPCDFNYRDFPYDVQRCQLTLRAKERIQDVWFMIDKNEEAHYVRQMKTDKSAPMIGDFVMHSIDFSNAVVLDDSNPVDTPTNIDSKHMDLIATLYFERHDDHYFYAFGLPVVACALIAQSAFIFDIRQALFLLAAAFLMLYWQMVEMSGCFPSDADGTPVLALMHYVEFCHILLLFFGLLILYAIYRQPLNDDKSKQEEYFISPSSAYALFGIISGLLLAVVIFGVFFVPSWHEWDKYFA